MTLTEVLIALLVIALAVLAMVSTQAFGMRALSVDPIRQQAAAITNRALTKAELSLSDDFSQSVAQVRQADEDFPEFEVEIFEVIEDPPQNLLKRVTVRTIWRGKQGEESLELWTVFVDETAIAP